MLLWACSVHSLNYTCMNKLSEKFPSNNHHCYIHTPADLNWHQQTYNFKLDYADPNQIERFSFRPARRVFVAAEHLVPQIFNTFPNLKQLAIEKSLKELYHDDFAGAMNLNTMWLAANKLRIIRNDVFSPITRMEQLSLSRGIPRTDDTVFPLHKLIDLSLSHNEISEIEDNSFAGLNHLLDLDLPHNRLTVIHRKTFAGLPSLHNLNLDDNKIHTIEEGAFDLPALMGLFLSENKLKTLPDGVFQPLRNIVAIKLDDNELDSIGQSLTGIQTLQTISLKRNRIRDVDLTKFAELPHLIELSLTRSGFTFATTHIEGGQHWNSSLTELNIDDNDLTAEIELEKLKVFPRLEVLNLDGNSFTEFEMRGQRSLKDILPALSLLYLRGTEIDCIDITSLARELGARNLDVVHNCTVQVPKNMII